MPLIHDLLKALWEDLTEAVLQLRLTTSLCNEQTSLLSIMNVCCWGNDQVDGNQTANQWQCHRR